MTSEYSDYSGMAEDADELGELPASESFTAKRKKKRSISFSDDPEGTYRSESPEIPANVRFAAIPPPPPPKPSTPEWYEDLDDTRMNMFKQVFEMLDTDGGGTIEAEELYNVMKDLEIDVTLDEIKKTLYELDKDGNGEIDFDEFLFCMSETDKYLDSLTAEGEEGEDQPHYSKRQTLFFTAITKFAMKNSIGEIERYYANKIRQAPHVISCYTAGARLIGLNDRQLEQEIRRMQKEAKNSNSPYAKPLPFFTLKKKKKKKTSQEKRQSLSEGHQYKRSSVSSEGKRSSVSEPHSGKRQSVAGGPPPPPSDFGAHHPAAESTSSDDILDDDFRPPERLMRDRRKSAVMPDDEMLDILNELAKRGNVVARIPDIHLVPGLKQKLGAAEPLCSSVRKRKKLQQDTNHKSSDKKKNYRKKTIAPQGWVIPRMERRQMPLPVIPVPKNRYGKPFTIEDVPEVRTKVSKATDTYYSNLKTAYVRAACEQWDNLHPEQIRSETLANAFRRVYRAYSPHKEEEVLALCPWIPGPRYKMYTARQPRVVMERQRPPPPLPPRPKSCPYRTSTPTPRGPNQAQPRSHSSCSGQGRPSSRCSKD